MSRRLMRSLVCTPAVFGICALVGTASAASDSVAWPTAVASCAPGIERYGLCPQNDPNMVHLFDAAKHGDVAAVKATPLVSNPPDTYRDAQLALARAFALALADPKTYTAAYVDLFGRGSFTDYRFLSGIADAGLAPDIAFTIVEKRALAGDGVAVAAVLGAVAPLNEFRAPFSPDRIVANSALVFAALKARGPVPVALYLCTANDEDREPEFAHHVVRSLRADAKTALGRSLVAKLSALTATCGGYDING